MHFFFPHRCRFITSADANRSHVFLLATGPQKVTQILLPSSQVGNGSSQNNNVHGSERAPAYRGSCSNLERMLCWRSLQWFGVSHLQFALNFFALQRTKPLFPNPVFLLAICTSHLLQVIWIIPNADLGLPTPHALWNFTTRSSAQIQLLRPDSTIAQCPEWEPINYSG